MVRSDREVWARLTGVGCALIINADDLGYDPAVTRGILEAMRQGVVSSATLIVNGPYSEAAAAQAQSLAIGLHLNLARFVPAWSGFPPALLTQGTFDEGAAGRLPAEVVERETLAQLDRLERLLGRSATHVDVHKHLHRHPAILEGVAAAARTRGLPVRSVDAAMRALLAARGVPTNDHFVGDAGAEAFWTLERLEREAERLPAEGVTEWMCHPGYAPASLRSGYSVQRETELRTFVHPQARTALDRLGLSPTHFRVVHGR